MSHNIAHFNTLAPSREGAVDPALSDLSDVSGSPTDGQLLAYSGAGWAPTSSSPGDAVGAVARAHGGGATSASSVTIISPNPYIGNGLPRLSRVQSASRNQRRLTSHGSEILMAPGPSGSSVWSSTRLEYIG